jgi:hypothetical protein
MGTKEPGHEPQATTSDEAAELIRACDARPANHIKIAGCGNLELVIEFLRLGFAEAGCRADRRPHDGPRHSDILVIPHVSNDLALLHAVARLGGDLRPGGMLVLRDDRPLPDVERRQLLRLLTQRGFAPIDGGTAWLRSGGILRLRKATESAEVRAA